MKKSSENSAKFRTPRELLKQALEKFWLARWAKTVRSLRARDQASKSRQCFNGQRGGAIIYDSTNVGDEIQTLAQLTHLPETSGADVVPCHREYLNTISAPARLVLMMNGWFTHMGQNWPPSDKVNPVFVGFHASNPDLTKEWHADYYKQYEPIGCRDTATVRRLESIGVAAYFSGCPTLTLERPALERTDEILVVDAHVEHADVHIPDGTDLLRALVPSSVLDKAAYLTHRTQNYQHNWHGYKLNQAIRLLERYARAKLVVTSRLHCALPCLAFGTPCVFLNKALYADPRLTDYTTILRGYSSTCQKVDINWENPEPLDISAQRTHLIGCINEAFKRCLQP